MEEWKDVVGYEGLYQVSNLGNIRCLGFEGQHKVKGKRKYMDHITVYKDSNGYSYVNLCHPVKKRKHCMLHRLVAQAFIDNPEGKPQVNHINGFRSDNKIENLEWVTCEENLRHARECLKNKNLPNQNKYSRKIIGNKIMKVKNF